MIKDMPISKARDKLTSLHSELTRTKDTIAVTSRGKAILAVLPWDLYESIMETLDIASDPDLMASLRTSLREAEEGDTVELSESEID